MAIPYPFELTIVFLRYRLLAALLFAVSQAVGAQPTERSYAILSLIGDSVSIHTVRSDLGGRIPGENKIVLPYPSSVFDQAALLAAGSAIKALAPGARTTLMMSQDLALYQAQNAMFEAAASNQDNRNYLLSLLKAQKVSHLVLITKLRDNAALELSNGFAGHGRLEGLGFFVDDTIEVRTNESRELRNGIVAPFAYVKVRLLDASTLAVVHEVKATESMIVARPSTAAAAGTWAAVSDADKVAYLGQLITQALEAATPDLLPR